VLVYDGDCPGREGSVRDEGARVLKPLRMNGNVIRISQSENVPTFHSVTLRSETERQSPSRQRSGLGLGEPCQKWQEQTRRKSGWILHGRVVSRFMEIAFQRFGKISAGVSQRQRTPFQTLRTWPSGRCPPIASGFVTERTRRLSCRRLAFVVSLLSRNLSKTPPFGNRHLAARQRR